MNRDPHEQALLEHYRRHSDEQPSAQLDARILAAARAAVQEHKPRFAQRLHRWLLGAGSHQRWGVAVAGLATLGIGLSLTLRTFDEAPQRFDAPVAPAMMRAPAPAPAMAPPAAPAVEAYSAAPALQSAPAGAVLDEAVAPKEQAKRKAEATARSLADLQKAAKPSADAKASAQLAEEGEPHANLAQPQKDEEPRDSLALLRDLQERGDAQGAARVRDSLRQRFPDLDIDKALKELPDAP